MYKNRLIDRRYPSIPHRIIYNTIAITTMAMLMDFDDNKWVDNNVATSKWSTSGKRGGTVKSNVKKSYIILGIQQPIQQYAEDPVGPLYLKVMMSSTLISKLNGALSGKVSYKTGTVAAILNNHWYDLMVNVLGNGLVTGINLTMPKIQEDFKTYGIPVGTISTDMLMTVYLTVFSSLDVILPVYGSLAQNVVYEWNRFVAAAEEAQNRVNTEGYYDDDGVWHYKWSGYTVDGFGISLDESKSIDVECRAENIVNGYKNGKQYGNTSVSIPALYLGIKTTTGKYTLIPE